MDDLWWTGLALTNPGADMVTLTVDGCLDNGTLRDRTTLSLGAKSKAAALVADIFPQSFGELATLRLVGSRPILALAVYGEHKEKGRLSALVLH